MQFSVSLARPLNGTAAVPADPAEPVEALMLASLAVGRTRLDGVTDAGPALDALADLAAFGIDAARAPDSKIVLHGVGVSGLPRPRAALRAPVPSLALGLLSSIPGTSFAGTGETPPVSVELFAALTAMGVSFLPVGGGSWPLAVSAPATLIPIDWSGTACDLDLLRGLMLAGLHAPGQTSLTMPAWPETAFERRLRAMGAVLTRTLADNGRLTATIRGHVDLVPRDSTIGGDPLVAATVLALAAGQPGAVVRLEHVTPDPMLEALVALLGGLGGEVLLECGREGLVDVIVRGSRLRATALAADELAAAGPLALAPVLGTAGRTQVEGYRAPGGLDDRRDLLHRLGARTEEAGDGLLIDPAAAATGTPVEPEDEPQALLALAAGATLYMREPSRRVRAALDLAARLGATITTKEWP